MTPPFLCVDAATGRHATSPPGCAALLAPPPPFSEPPASQARIKTTGNMICAMQSGICHLMLSIIVHKVALQASNRVPQPLNFLLLDLDLLRHRRRRAHASGWRVRRSMQARQAVAQTQLPIRLELRGQGQDLASTFMLVAIQSTGRQGRR